jgi:hypothetical protein
MLVALLVVLMMCGSLLGTSGRGLRSRRGVLVLALGYHTR